MPVELKMKGEREDDADAKAGNAAKEGHDAIEVRKENSEEDESGDNSCAEEEAQGWDCGTLFAGVSGTGGTGWGIRIGRCGGLG